MSSPFFLRSFTFRLRDGSFPRYHGAVIGDALWLTIGKLKLLDIPWTLLQEDPPRDDLKEGITKSSRVQTDSVRLLRLPAPLSAPVWWRAYQPVYPSKGDRWFIVTSEDDILERLDTRETEETSYFLFPMVLAREIVRDCRRLEDDLKTIRLFSSFPPQTSIPIVPRLAALHEPYYAATDIIEVYIELLCYYWGGQGVFHWWGSQNDLYSPQFHWKERLPPLLRKRVSEWGLETLPSRGVIVNMATDHHRTDLNLMVHAEIGFIYRWTRGLQEDSRYLRWSPEYLARLVLFSTNCEIQRIPLREEDFARQFAGIVRTVTSYDFSLSRIEAVRRPSQSFLNIVKVVNGISNAYLALIEGWEPLAVDTNLEWNELARYFQVNLASKADVQGTVYVAIAQRPYADSILLDGATRRHISRVYSPWEAMSGYWTVPRIQKWMAHGMYSPSLVVTQSNRRHGSVLFDAPYYPPPEFDELLFHFFLPITNHWRMGYLRDGEVEELVAATSKDYSLLLSSSAPMPPSPKRPSSWSHTVAKDLSIDNVKNGAKEPSVPKAPIVPEMVVNLRKEYGGKEGQVRDSVGHRLLWGVIGNVNRTKTKELMKAKVQAANAGANEESSSSASPSSLSILKRLEALDQAHFTLVHQWPLNANERRVAQVLTERANLHFPWEAELCIKLMVSRDKKRRTVKEVIFTAIEHGIPFQFIGRSDDLAALQGTRPNSTTLSPDNDLSIMAATHGWNLSRVFFSNEGPECGNEFLRVLQIIGTHEFASSLVGRGGIISYIVRTHLPHLVNDFLAGMSPQTTRWRGGDRVIAPSDGQEIWVDDPPPELIDLAVGLRYDEINPDGGSIFPHPDWFETDPDQVVKTTKKRTLWTPWVWESSLMAQLQNFSASLEKGTAKVRTRSQWSRWFRTNRQSKIPWEAIAEEVDDLHDLGFGGRWSDWSLTELQNELTQSTN